MLLVACVVVSLSLGRHPIGPADALEPLVSRVVPCFGGWSVQQEATFFNVRLPCVALAVSGRARRTAGGLRETTGMAPFP